MIVTMDETEDSVLCFLGGGCVWGRGFGAERVTDVRSCTDGKREDLVAQLDQVGDYDMARRRPKGIVFFMMFLSRCRHIVRRKSTHVSSIPRASTSLPSAHPPEMEYTYVPLANPDSLKPLPPPPASRLSATARWPGSSWPAARRRAPRAAGSSRSGSAAPVQSPAS